MFFPKRNWKKSSFYGSSFIGSNFLTIQGRNSITLYPKGSHIQGVVSPNGQTIEQNSCSTLKGALFNSMHFITQIQRDPFEVPKQRRHDIK